MAELSPRLSDVLTVQQAAERAQTALGCPNEQSTIRRLHRLIERRELTAWRVGREWLIEKKELQRLRHRASKLN